MPGVPELPDHRPTQGVRWDRIVIGTALLMFCGWYVLHAQSSQANDPVQRGLYSAAQRTANQDANGTLTSESLAETATTARAATGCGWVQTLVAPAPQPPPQQGLGAPPQQADPVALAKDYAVKEFRPDGLVVLSTEDGSKVVIAMGWSCP